MPRNHRSQQHYRNRGSEHGAHAKPHCVRYIPQAQLAPHDSYQRGQIRSQRESGLRLTHKLNPKLISIK